MIVVIQCASRKDTNAGYLSTLDGQPVKFVAKPKLAPKDRFLYQHPDDVSDRGIPWKEVLENYNKDPHGNPNGLLPAWRLYTPTRPPSIYQRLVDRFGVDNIFILSAGWGLINADFLTPYYDITFSTAKNVDSYKRRNITESYDDFCLLPKGIDDQMVFCGGKSYIPLFCTLTRDYKGRRVIFYNSPEPPSNACGDLMRFPTTRRTNWHYSCAELLLIEGI